MSDLKKYFENNNSNLINKWLHYFDIYERYFSKYRGTDVVILEIGVYQGGSLKMWKHYFGDRAKLYAVDINPLCKQFEDNQTKIFIGSQEDRMFLQNLKKQIPKVDILIDDGGHYMNQQIVAFEEMFNHIKEDGIYLCEDLHTSYWNSYGGGINKKETYIEYTKGFIDKLHAWHYEAENLSDSEFTKGTYSIHYYDSIIVLEKRSIQKPISKMTGIAVIDESEFSIDDTRHLHSINHSSVKSISVYERIKNKVKSFLK